MNETNSNAQLLAALRQNNANERGQHERLMDSAVKLQDLAERNLALLQADMPSATSLIRELHELTFWIRNGKQPDPLPPVFDVCKAVRVLNVHHRKTAAGFYGSAMGGRFFKARSRNGCLEVYDFDQWFPVTADKAKFHDHNGRDIPLL